jgi:hypothetical protein
MEETEDIIYLGTEKKRERARETETQLRILLRASIILTSELICYKETLVYISHTYTFTHSPFSAVFPHTILVVEWDDDVRR